MVTSTESRTRVSELLTDAEELRAEVEIVVNSTPVMDAHTHLFPSEFNELCLYGIDALLTYHYLTAETFRSARIAYDKFWSMSKTEQADLVWKTLFVDNTPTSEAAQGIISVLDAFGLDTRAPDLKEARAFFNSLSPAEQINQVFDIARVSGVVMTNDPLDQAETQIWNTRVNADQRFKASLRLDCLLNHWEEAIRALSRQGVFVTWDLQTGAIDAIRGWLAHWVQRMNPVYMAVSLPADFEFRQNPIDDDIRARLLREVVLPAAKEHGLTLTLMVGVRRGVNSGLREAGDAVGR